MNNGYLYLIFLGFLISCSGNEKSYIDSTIDTDEIIQTSSIIEFESDLRPDKKEWDLNETYKDTLEFESFEDQYDYWMAIFKTKSGSSVSLNYNDPIEASLNHSIFAIEWEIDSFYEAGEGDELYYDEKLISYQIIEKSNDFAGYLYDFIHAYSREDDKLIENYIHSELGFLGTTQPGLYCMLEKRDKPEISNFMTWESVISHERPDGDICGGYEGVEDGLYYSEIKADEIEDFTFNIPGGDFEFHPPVLPEKYKDNALKKVQVITNESHYAYLYFVLMKDQWYLWIENRCDCSA